MVKLPSLSTLILLHVLPAFLPETPKDEKSYYDVLQVSKSASQEDIRKAFRKISLQLHPDKLQQRGLDPKDYEVEYQLVQEAYGVLSDKKKRNEYNNLGDSPSRYQFVASGNLYNPQSLLENLARADSNAKTRIVLLLAIVTGMILLQPVLICVKINHLFDGGSLENTSWMLLLIPTWVLQGFFCIVIAGVLVVAEEKSQIALNCLGNVCWLVGMILLALRWDRTIDADYALIFIPFYIYMATRYMSSILAMLQAKQQVDMMITQIDLEQVLGKPLSDLAEEERTALEDKYIIVHLPPEEGATVEDSPEYEAAIDFYYEINTNLLNGICIGIPLVVLIVLKVDGTLQDTNWWLIFLPVWIYLFVNGVYNCNMCCWAVGSEIVVSQMEADLEEAAAAQAEVESTPSAHMYVPPEGLDAAEFTTSPMKVDEAPGGTSSVQAETKSASTPAVPSTPTAAAVPLMPEAPASMEKFDDEFTPAKDLPTKTSDPDIERMSLNFTDEEGNDIHVDHETFAEWNQAYQEAQASAKEAQLKGQGNCCSILVQVMMMSLIVGKLEQAYTEPDGGFNAIWILFPIFVLSGCILCCCACMIYGVGGEAFGTQDEGDENAPTTEEPATITTPVVAIEEPTPVVVTTAPVTGFVSDDLD
jgi:DnaJ domain